MTIARDAVAEKVRNHRGDLEAIADSDLRCAKYAEELLALVDETDVSGDVGGETA